MILVSYSSCVRGLLRVGTTVSYQLSWWSSVWAVLAASVVPSATISGTMVSVLLPMCLRFGLCTIESHHYCSVPWPSLLYSHRLLDTMSHWCQTSHRQPLCACQKIRDTYTYNKCTIAIKQVAVVIAVQFTLSSWYTGQVFVISQLICGNYQLSQILSTDNVLIATIYL